MIKKLLFKTNSIFIVLLSLFAFGCSSNTLENIDKKSVDEIMESLKNSSLTMESIDDEEKNTLYFVNTDKYFIYTTIFSNLSEYGYIYNKEEQTLYSLDNLELAVLETGMDAKNKICEKLQKTCIFFYKEFNSSLFVSEGEEKIANRTCKSYSFDNTNDDIQSKYTFYIDPDTGVCLGLDSFTYLPKKTLSLSVRAIEINYDVNINKYIELEKEYKNLITT